MLSIALSNISFNRKIGVYMLKKIADKLSFFAHPKQQIFPISLFILIIIYFLHNSLVSFKSLEKFPKVFKPEEIFLNTLPVNVSFNIQHFSEFDIVHDSLTFEGNIWFNFDPKELTEIDLEDFSFELGEIKKKIKIVDKTVKNKRIIGYSIKISLISNLNYRLFPVDDHRIYIILTNHQLKDKKIRFVPDQFLLNSDITIQDWVVNKIFHGSGKVETSIEAHGENIYFPAMIYQIDIMRYGNREILLILVPIFALLFLCFILFSFNNYDTRLISITASLIATFIAYRFTIDNLMPKVGYITLADYIFLFFFVLSIFVFYFSCFYSSKFNRYRGLILLILYIIALIWLYYMLFIWA
jgi:hypothetical protein